MPYKKGFGGQQGFINFLQLFLNFILFLPPSEHLDFFDASVFMSKLNDNAYNQTLSKDKPKLKLWTSMGLLLTYKCPAECAFCYYKCGPKKNGLISLAAAINAWQGLIAIAGKSAKIHITGGEPFLYWDHLAQLLEIAAKQQLGDVDMIETNGCWADNKSDIIEKLKFLDSHNVKKLKISYDPFHAEFIDYHKVKLLYETACQVLGTQRVLVRWQEYLEKDLSVKNLSENEKAALFANSLKAHPCRFTGRAAEKFTQVPANKEVEEIAKLTCQNAYLSAKGIHIDPYGNVFSGVCSGIIIGNINEKPLEEIWRDFNPTKKEFLSVLFNKGPVGLLEKAIKDGYQKSRLYLGKCQLCTALRQFFFDNGQFRQIIGPKDCYV